MVGSAFQINMQLPISSLARKHQSSSHKLDFWFLGIAMFISLFGLLMVYDASQFEAYQSFADKSGDRRQFC